MSRVESSRWRDGSSLMRKHNRYYLHTFGDAWLRWLFSSLAHRLKRLPAGLPAVLTYWLTSVGDTEAARGSYQSIYLSIYIYNAEINESCSGRVTFGWSMLVFFVLPLRSSRVSNDIDKDIDSVSKDKTNKKAINIKIDTQ